MPDQSLSDCNDNKCLALLPLRQGRDGETRIKVEEEHKDEAESEATLQKQVMLSLAPQYQHFHREQQRVIAGWEGFIPQQHLRVLLVESDDSTRHVVCALLRNCGYEGNIVAVRQCVLKQRWTLVTVALEIFCIGL